MKHRISFHHGQLSLNGAVLPLFGADWDWWRTPPQQWPEQAAALADQGVNTVFLAAPWGLHEPAPGRFDFSERLDWVRLLGVLQQAGLRACLGLGPLGPDSLPQHGLPPWVLRSEDLLARNHRRQPFWVATPFGAYPRPSEASPAFLDTLWPFLKHLGEQTAPFATADGPVIGVGFRTHVHSLGHTLPPQADHHPAALAHYHGFLRNAYAQDSHLAAAHRQADLTFAQASPPGPFDGKDPLLPHLDWLNNQQALAARCLSQLKNLAQQAGFNEVFFSLDLTFSRWGPLPAMAGLKAVQVLRLGGDFSGTGTDADLSPFLNMAGLWGKTVVVNNQALDRIPSSREEKALDGEAKTPALFISSGSPVSSVKPCEQRRTVQPNPKNPLFMDGIRIPYAPRTSPDRAKPAAGTAIHGLWPRVPPIWQAAQTQFEHDLDTAGPSAPTALLFRSRLDEDLSVLGHALPTLLDFTARCLGLEPHQRHALAGALPQFSTPLMGHQPFWFGQMTQIYTQALTALGHRVAFADETLGLDTLKPAPLVVAPCLGVMERPVAQHLSRLAAQGALVVIGPSPPLCDLWGHALSWLPPPPTPTQLDHQRTVSGVALKEEWLFEGHRLAVPMQGVPSAVVFPHGSGFIAYLTGVSGGPPELAAPVLANFLAELVRRVKPPPVEETATAQEPAPDETETPEETPATETPPTAFQMETPPPTSLPQNGPAVVIEGQIP